MSKLILLVEQKHNNQFLCASDKAYELLGDISYSDLLNDYKTHNYHTFKDYLNSDNYIVKTPDEYEHDPDVPVFYLVKIAITQDHFNPIWINGISKKSLQLLKDHNIPIMLSQPKEYFTDHISDRNHFHTSSLSNFLNKKLCEIGLFTNSLILHGIVYSTSHEKYFYEGHRKIYNHYSYYFFTRSKIFVDNPNNFCTIDKHNFKDKTKLSICINRQPREIRCLILTQLVSYLNDCVFTMLGEEPVHNALTQAQINEIFKNNINLIKDESFKNELLKKLEIFKTRYPGNYRIKENAKETKNHADHNYKLNEARQNVIFELVTETHEYKFKDAEISIITEKTLWPILNQMPFSVIGHIGNYKFLKELGFDLFEDWLLMEYQVSNSIEDLLKHCDAMLQRISSDIHIEKLYNESKIKCKNNFDLLYNTDWNLKEKEELEKLFWIQKS